MGTQHDIQHEIKRYKGLLKQVRKKKHALCLLCQWECGALGWVHNPACLEIAPASIANPKNIRQS